MKPEELKNKYDDGYNQGTEHPRWKGGDLNITAQMRHYYRNRDKFLADHRTYYQRFGQIKHQQYRKDALSIVGNGEIKCSRCGCNELSILEVNHLNGTGGLKRGDRHRAGLSLWRGICNGVLNKGDFNVLCKVCNIIHYVKMAYGIDNYEIKWQ